MKKKTIIGLAALGAVLGAATVTGIVFSKKRKQKQLSDNEKIALSPKRNIYFAGGGLAALSGAYYLIHDCNIPGECIHIFEESNAIGGAFNIGGNEETGYVCTAPKLLSLRNHANLMDMLKNISSVNLQDMSVADEILNYMDANPINENSRIMEDKESIKDGFNVSKAAVKNIKSLLSAKDCDICDISIEDFFIDTPEFFNSNLWIIVSTSYILPRTASSVELKHILNCVSGEMNELFALSNAVRSQLNLQETIIKALENYLAAHNVNFATHCSVVDVDFEKSSYKLEAIHLDDNGTAKTFYLNEKDLLFITNGSVSECASIGDYNSSASEIDTPPASAVLWRKMTEKRDGLGNPDIFFSSKNSEIVSFTITSKTSKLIEYIKAYTKDINNQGVLTTFKNSPWRLTVSKVAQPYFSSQTDDTHIICGYGINVNTEGKYIDKTMKDANGAEILFELVKLIKREQQWGEIVDDIINVVPCLMPYAAASSKPHDDNDKPLVVKNTECNFAFIGQFAKLGSGISYSSEYAVRTAREAAYRLTGTKKNSIPPTKAAMTSYVKMFKSLKK